MVCWRNTWDLEWFPWKLSSSWVVDYSYKWGWVGSVWTKAMQFNSNTIPLCYAAPINAESIAVSCREVEVEFKDRRCQIRPITCRTGEFPDCVSNHQQKFKTSGRFSAKTEESEVSARSCIASGSMRGYRILKFDWSGHFRWRSSHLAIKGCP